MGAVCRRTWSIVATCGVVAATQLLGPGLTASFAADGPPQVAQLLEVGQDCAAPSGVTVTGTPWPAAASDLQHARQLGQGASVTVGLVDTGVSLAGAPPLAGQVTTGRAVVSNGTPDCVGHGTFLAGLIAGRTDPATGFSGIAPAAHIFSVSVTDEEGDATADQIAQGIEEAVNAGARVIDVSVVSAEPSQQLSDAVAHATAAGALVVAPATLDGQQKAAPIYPAAYPGVLAVADVPASGVTIAGTQVAGAPADVAAMGDGIVSAGLGGSAFVGNGASYAAAFVAGTAALMESYLGPLSPLELTQRLEATAVHPGTTVPDPLLGFGIVDPEAALTTILPGSPAQTGSALGPAPTVTPQPPATAKTTALLIAAIVLGASVLVGLGMLAAVARARRLRAQT